MSEQPEHGPGSVNADRLYAEIKGDFRKAYPGDFSFIAGPIFGKRPRQRAGAIPAGRPKS